MIGDVMPKTNARDTAERLSAPGDRARRSASRSREVNFIASRQRGASHRAGLMFAGNPDTVDRQIMDFDEKVGGFGHLIRASRSGFMTHAEAEKGLTLFAKAVLPRLRDVGSLA